MVSLGRYVINCCITTGSELVAFQRRKKYFSANNCAKKENYITGNNLRGEDLNCFAYNKKHNRKYYPNSKYTSIEFSHGEKRTKTIGECYCMSQPCQFCRPKKDKKVCRVSRCVQDGGNGSCNYEIKGNVERKKHKSKHCNTSFFNIWFSANPSNNTQIDENSTKCNTEGCFTILFRKGLCTSSNHRMAGAKAKTVCHVSVVRRKCYFAKDESQNDIDDISLPCPLHCDNIIPGPECSLLIRSKESLLERSLQMTEDKRVQKHSKISCNNLNRETCKCAACGASNTKSKQILENTIHRNPVWVFNNDNNIKDD